jgi:hypothetical protein
MEPSSTRIGDKDMRVKSGPRTKVYFCGHCEWRDPAGYYDFWTIAKKTEARVHIVRWPTGGNPGDRFRKMEGDPDYKKVWEFAQTADVIYASLLTEVQDWLDGHPGDAPCAQFGEAEGQSFKVERRFIVKIMPPPTEPSS